MVLIEITIEGAPAREIKALPEIAADVMKSTAEMYKAAGCLPPWVGYLALDGDDCVGTCAFKKPPANGRVEIAYFIFPGNEGRGIASRMAECLIGLARREMPEIRIYAQTLPEQSASTHILEKLGFRKLGAVEHPEDGIVWEWELMTKARQGAVPDADSTAPHLRR
jgi:[ribosomal protein S5]-alanine N-acetyltransferase